MNFGWKITKYDPKKRNQQGRFLEDTWTSYSDIGKIYAGKQFDLDEYMIYEDLYINAIECFMKELEISDLYVSELEKRAEIECDGNSTENMIVLCAVVYENYLLDAASVADMACLVLREYLWCNMINDQKMCVHFGYDYYMYIGSHVACPSVIQKIKDSGLYVEEYILV